MLEESRDWFGARDLPAAGVHLRVGHVLVDGPKHALNQIAAVVRLADHPVGLVLPEELDRTLGPGIGAHAAAGVLDDKELAGAVPACDDQPTLVGALAAAHRRVDGHHDPHQVFGGDEHARLLERLTSPERARRFVQNLTEDLLPGQRRAFVALQDRREELRREVVLVGIGAHATRHARRVAHQFSKQPARPRRRRERSAGHLTQAQTEPKVRHGLGAPRRALITDGEVVLRASELVALGVAVRSGLRSIGPGEPPLAGLVSRHRMRPVLAAHLDDPRVALYQHVPRVRRSARHRGDACAGVLLRHAASPSGERRRLARAAAAQKEPERPRPIGRRELLIASPEVPAGL